MVMDKVMNVLKDTATHMMVESIDGDGCDGCDGKNEKSDELETSLENKVDCNTNNKEDLEKKEISDKVGKMPSPRSSEESQSHAEHEVESNHFAITVGDLVTVEDCPVHWSWASPFTVRAIDGEMVVLEMVNELIEIGRLEKL